MGLNKIAVILFLCLFISSSVFAGGDGPFPIRVAVSKVWVSDLAKHRVIVKIDVAERFKNGDARVFVRLVDYQSLETVALGSAVLKRGDKSLAAKVLGRDQQSIDLNLQVRFSEQQKEFKMVMTMLRESDGTAVNLVLSELHL